jgi:hypothetical protein
MLFNDLVRLELQNPAAEERAYLINSLLDDAGKASVAKVGIRKWWWGTEIERAWARLREVEERAVDLLPDAELRARGAEALAHANFYLKGDDKRRQHLEALLVDAWHAVPVTMASALRSSTTNFFRAPHAQALTATMASALRSSIVDVLRASHAQADRNNQQARYLRNRLIIASAVSVLFAVLIVLAQWWMRDIPFLAAPIHWPGSAWSYILVVMLFGAIGALITAIQAISNIPLDSGPFNLPLQQALLKLVLGPLVALIGLLILDTDVLQIGMPKSWAGVLVLAIVFGAGQQAVTRYVDQRASEVLTAIGPGSATK